MEIYSRETVRGRTHQYHGHAITPDGVTLTIYEAARLIGHFISTSVDYATIVKGEIRAATKAEPGVYIGSGIHNRKLADLKVTEGRFLHAISVDEKDVYFVKDVSLPSMTGDPDEPWFCLKCDGHMVRPAKGAEDFVICLNCGAYTNVREHYFVMSLDELEE